jgi:hypothetical protein
MVVVPLVVDPEIPDGGVEVQEIDAPVVALVKSTKVVV